MAGSDWFSQLLGFAEGAAGPLLAQLCLDGEVLKSKRSGETFTVGRFSTPSLGELRAVAQAALADSVAVAKAGLRSKGPTLCNVLGDAAEFHRNTDNRLATFQVASQFNCLEFVGPKVTPEHGITGYVQDKTQGPCCAIACGPATVYRNYFAKVRDASGRVVAQGQRANCQIENLRDLAAAVGKRTGDISCFPRVEGGYTFASDGQLRKLNVGLSKLSDSDLDEVCAALRIGVQEDTQVTSHSWGRCRLRDQEHLVTQVFASACSVSYSGNSSRALWEPLASLILRASYEATLWVAVLNALRHSGEAGSRRVFLTAVGGGVFGNSMEWVASAIRGAMRCLQAQGLALEVRIVGYGAVDPVLKALAGESFTCPAAPKRKASMDVTPKAPTSEGREAAPTPKETQKKPATAKRQKTMVAGSRPNNVLKMLLRP